LADEQKKHHQPYSRLRDNQTVNLECGGGDGSSLGPVAAMTAAGAGLALAIGLLMTGSTPSGNAKGDRVVDMNAATESFENVESQDNVGTGDPGIRIEAAFSGGDGPALAAPFLLELGTVPPSLAGPGDMQLPDGQGGSTPTPLLPADEETPETVGPGERVDGRLEEAIRPAPTRKAMSGANDKQRRRVSPAKPPDEVVASAERSASRIELPVSLDRRDPPLS